LTITLIISNFHLILKKFQKKKIIFKLKEKKMKSKLLVYFLPVILTVFLIYGYGLNDNPFKALSETKEYKSLSLDGNPIVMTTAGDSCHGTGQEKHDDGSMENGLGYNETVTDAHIVSKFRPSSYPWKYTKFCVGITKSPAAAPDSLIFSVVIFDSTGPGGQPGNILGTLSNQVAKPIPTFSAFTWFSFDISNVTGNLVTDGAIYIGVRYDGAPLNQRSKFFSFDTSPTTLLWPGYAKSAAANPWTRVDSLGATFATFRCLAMRTMGETPTPVTLIDPDRVCDYLEIPQYPPSTSGLWGHASTALGDTLYIAGGSTTATGDASTVVTRYAINSGVWSAGRPLPGAKSGGDLVASGGNLYYIGGGASVTVGNGITYKYDPVAGWTTVAPQPSSVTGNVAESWGDSVIFCISGGWTTYLTTIQVYRPATNTWSTSTPLPAGAGRRSFAGGLDGNKIIVAAGWSGVFRKDVRIGTIGANANTITWTTAPDVPMRGTGSSRPGGHAVNGRFYFITGETSPAPFPQDSIYVMDAVTNTWLPVAWSGRGANAASNYWGAISSTILPNGRIKVWIPGGSLAGVTTTKLFVLTDSIGCVITNISNNNSSIPETYDLSQNYPNPFNPVTKINFSIPKSGLVTLKIYDILGKEVAVLVNEVKDAGNYTFDFNASHLASGAYFYRIEAGDFRAVKKMMLLK
jgi:hypothetical protein